MGASWFGHGLAVFQERDEPIASRALFRVARPERAVCVAWRSWELGYPAHGVLPPDLLIKSILPNCTCTAMRHRRLNRGIPPSLRRRLQSCCRRFWLSASVVKVRWCFAESSGRNARPPSYWVWSCGGGISVLVGFSKGRPQTRGVCGRGDE